MLVLALALTTVSSTADAMEPVRTDMSVGMSRGQASHDRTPLSLMDGDDHGALVLAPFSETPYADVTHRGLDLEMTTVVRHVRVSVGYRLPISDFAMEDTLLTLADGSEVATRRLEVHQIELGFGYELPVQDSPVVPYLELVGATQLLRADLAMAEGIVPLGGRSFRLMAKGGMQLRFDEHAFIDLHGQSTVDGQDAWSVGVAIGASMF